MRAALLVILLALSGCHVFTHHRDTNAPGRVDIATPPPGDLPAGATRLPDDPGERMITFNPGIFGGASYAPGRDGDRVRFPIGIELTLNRGERDRSHFRDDFFVYPASGEGLNLGWAALELGADELEIGPIYLEYQRFETLYGAAGGIAFDPDDVDFGAQGTVWYGPYYLQARYLLDGGAELAGGLQLKVPVVWVWSQ
jgi:hypothetical protein